jgi:hypothetical protein
VCTVAGYLVDVQDRLAEAAAVDPAEAGTPGSELNAKAIAAGQAIQETAAKASEALAGLPTTGLGSGLGQVVQTAIDAAGQLGADLVAALEAGDAEALKVVIDKVDKVIALIDAALRALSTPAGAAPCPTLVYPPEVLASPSASKGVAEPPVAVAERRPAPPAPSPSPEPRRRRTRARARSPSPTPGRRCRRVPARSPSPPEPLAELVPSPSPASPPSPARQLIRRRRRRFTGAIAVARHRAQG